LKRGHISARGDELYCVQATASWSAQHIDLEREEIGALLKIELEKLAAQLGTSTSSMGSLVFERAHRWRFSGLDTPLSGEGADFDQILGLGCCGDSYHEGQILGALCSAAQLLKYYQDSWDL
jgi:predicted NAD/FAD-dependent oxidoreductase